MIIYQDGWPSSRMDGPWSSNTPNFHIVLSSTTMNVHLACCMLIYNDWSLTILVEHRTCKLIIHYDDQHLNIMGNHPSWWIITHRDGRSSILRVDQLSGKSAQWSCCLFIYSDTLSPVLMDDHLRPKARNPKTQAHSSTPEAQGPMPRARGPRSEDEGPMPKVRRQMIA